MIDKRTRLTRTMRYLTYDSGFDGTVEASDIHDPKFLRLSWEGGPKVPASDVDVASGIAAAVGHGAVVFVDSSFFHDRTDPDTVAALLATPNAVVVLPEVMQELTPYIERRPNSDIAKALASSKVDLRTHEWPARGEWRTTARDYYVGLLAMRKRMTGYAHLKFEDEHGHRPGEIDAPAIRTFLQRNFGDRGHLLAKKGHEAKGRTNRFTDELLVYAAAEHAITTGEGVILLTRDEDLAEQTYKLFWLIDTHYRSMLLADAYVDDFGRFPPLPFPPLEGDLGGTFKDGNNVLIRKPEGIENDLLPQLSTLVPFSCWVVGDYFSELTFWTEGGLERVLRVKGQTGGLNTDRMNGRNCHFWLAPLDLTDEQRGCAALAHDRRLQFPQTDARAPVLDMNQAIFNVERFRRLVQSPESRTGSLLIAQTLLDW